MDLNHCGIFAFAIVCFLTGHSGAECPETYKPVRGEQLRVVNHNTSVEPHEACRLLGDTLAETYLYNIHKLFKCEQKFIFKMKYYNVSEQEVCTDCQDTNEEKDISLYNAEDKCWCNSNFRQIHSASVVCKRATEETKLPISIGTPCWRRQKKLIKGRQISFIDDFETSYKRGGKGWKPGNYSCNWSFFPWNDNREDYVASVKLFVIFKYKRIDDFANASQCHVTFSATDSLGNYYNEPECIDRKTYQQILIEGNDISVNVFISNENQDPVKVEIIAQRQLINRPSVLPKEGKRVQYHTSEISLEEDYTWAEARDFCQTSLPNGDLCQIQKGLCPYHENHVEANPEKVIAVADGYNLWTSLQTEAVCDKYFSYNYSKIWDMDLYNVKGNCKDDKCSNKDIVFCCQHNKPLTMPSPFEIMIVLKSARTRDGYNVYKYRIGEPAEDYLWYGDEEYENWNDVGRIEGDVSKFYLQYGYSDNAPNRIYFCQLRGAEVSMEHYLISKKPCQTPWETMDALYVSFTPRPNITPLYVGVSTSGPFLRSRVSQTPFCCEFDDPGLSFVIYVPSEGLKRADVPPYHLCGDQTKLTDTSGEIFSPNYPQSYPEHIVCKWTIKVEEGKHVLVDLKELNLGYALPSCRYPLDFITFSNGKTKNLLGRVCGERNEPVKFESNSNELEVSFVASSYVDLDSRFHISYTTVNPSIESVPVMYDIDDDANSWKDAKQLCETNNQELCKMNEICPLFSDGIFTPENGTSYIAIQGDYNRWVVSKDTGECADYNANEGPPVFNENKTTHVDEYRDVVFCCSYSSSMARSFDTRDKIVAIFVTTMEDDYGTPQYRFSLTDEQPSYEVTIGDYEDYAYDYELPTVNKTWEAITRHPGDVFGFMVSSNFVEGVYDQVIYFCEAVNPEYSTIKKYKTSLYPCGGFWSFMFTVYGSKTQNEENTDKLTFANSIYNGASRISNEDDTCCGYESSVFNVYVANVLAPFVL